MNPSIEKWLSSQPEIIALREARDRENAEGDLTLKGELRPTINQIAWVFVLLKRHRNSGESFGRFMRSRLRLECPEERNVLRRMNAMDVPAFLLSDADWLEYLARTDREVDIALAESAASPDGAKTKEGHSGGQKKGRK